MCVHCEMKRQHEAMDWMRGRLKNVPDQHVLTFARILNDSMSLDLRGPQPLHTREEAIEILAAYFWAGKTMTNQMRAMLTAAYEDLSEMASVHGHAA